MDMAGIAKNITDFGVLVIIAAIFLYVIIKLVNIGFKHLETKINHKAHDRNMAIRSDVSYKINSLLESTLESCNGDRLQVIEFSNSAMSVAYMPFKYMTCTYEVYRPGKLPISSKIDHISTSLFTKFFETITNNAYFIFNTSNKDKYMGSAMYELMKSDEDYQSLCVLLKTMNGKKLGYLSMKKVSDFTEFDIQSMESLAERISALLSVLDK